MEGIKGPWRVGSSTGHNANMVYRWGPPGDPLADEAVAQVFPLPSHQTLATIAKDPRHAEGFARARLIAQAPAMAEALEKEMRFLDRLSTGDTHFSCSACKEAADEIRAILAAIKGDAAPAGPCWPSSAMEAPAPEYPSDCHPQGE